MNRFFRIALIGIAAAGVAVPAFAQSSQHRVGLHKIHRQTVVTRDSGLNAFAMVPGSAGGSAFSPAATGGGSIGYNENLRRNQW